MDQWSGQVPAAYTLSLLFMHGSPRQYQGADLADLGADFIGQLTGIVMIAAFTYVASYGVVKLIDRIMPIRATDEEQDLGLDVTEIGIEAYPEFK